MSADAEFDPRRIAEVLNSHRVVYVLVGVYAAQLSAPGHPHTTRGRNRGHASAAGLGVSLREVYCSPSTPSSFPRTSVNPWSTFHGYLLYPVLGAW